jgi:hypothetical protein
MPFRIGRTRIVSREEQRSESYCVVGFFFVFLSILAVYGSMILTTKLFTLSHVLQNVVSIPANATAATWRTLKHDTPVLVTLDWSQVAKLPSVYDADIKSHRFNHTIKLRRETEYLQWDEFHTTWTDDDGESHRTYYYIKNWRSYRILSILFDSPLMHHNPQRDPYPSSTWYAPNSKWKPVADVTLHIDSTLADHVPYEKLWRPAHRDQKAVEKLETKSGFAYIGNAYFYSAYQESSSWQVGRLLGAVLLGQWDFQLTDLFNQGNAGDIRMRYHTVQVDRRTVWTMVARVDRPTAHSTVVLRPFQTIPTSTAYIEYGNVSHTAFLERLASRFWWYKVTASILAMILAWIITMVGRAAIKS